MRYTLLYSLGTRPFYAWVAVVAVLEEVGLFISEYSVIVIFSTLSLAHCCWVIPCMEATAGVVVV